MYVRGISEFFVPPPPQKKKIINHVFLFVSIKLLDESKSFEIEVLKFLSTGETKNFRYQNFDPRV